MPAARSDRMLHMGVGKVLFLSARDSNGRGEERRPKKNYFSPISKLNPKNAPQNPCDFSYKRRGKGKNYTLEESVAAHAHGKRCGERGGREEVMWGVMCVRQHETGMP
ncbi:hypothetical protein P280DRAFT_98308 [Massarina eburnea CBS 473.64]|uniref:Uncharacterized protein n=1 Tax=Massarina eburnea CBS 473.64 TaxID=1395130 RepID=A0A6A6RS36_9PLEO|nr:hypothetical protein P280DRAFT_98308 [Massarina eburnea CBS 473.64]